MVRKLVASLASVMIAASAAFVASAAPNEEALAILEGLRGARGGVEVWVDERGAVEVVAGDKTVFHFRSARDGHLTAIYVDSNGTATVLLPTDVASDSAVEAGEDKVLELEMAPPYGRDALFAFATPEPIAPADLGLEPGSPIVETERVAELADRLAEALRRSPSAHVLAGRFDLRVVQRVASVASALPYTAPDIVRWAEITVRSKEPKALDLKIHFDFASDQLTDDARRQLDEVGKALRDSKMQRYDFVLAGHTDDVGTDAANLALSERRAKAAWRYLVQQFAVDSTLLEAQGFGETQPVVANRSEEARAENRRVELKMVR